MYIPKKTEIINKSAYNINENCNLLIHNFLCFVSDSNVCLLLIFLRSCSTVNLQNFVPWITLLFSAYFDINMCGVTFAKRFVYYTRQKFPHFFFILYVYFFDFTLKLLLAHIFLQRFSKTHFIEPHLFCFSSSRQLCRNILLFTSV